MSDNVPAWATTPLREVQNKRKLCKYWLRGQCAKNKEECLYAHGATDYSDSVPICQNWKMCRDKDLCRFRHAVRRPRQPFNIIPWKSKHQSVLDVGYDTPKKFMAYYPLILAFEKFGLPVHKDVLDNIVRCVMSFTPIEKYINFQRQVLIGYRTTHVMVFGLSDIVASTKVVSSNGRVNDILTIKRWLSVYEAMDADKKYPTWRIMSVNRQ